MLPCLWLSVSVCTSCKKWNFAVAKSEMLYMEKTLKLAFMYHKPLSVPFYGKTKLHNGRHLYNIFILNWRQKSRIFCGTSWVGSERRCGFGWMFFFLLSRSTRWTTLPVFDILISMSWVDHFSCNDFFISINLVGSGRR